MTKKHNPSCILIDFDGTLLNSIDSLFNAYCNFLNKYKIQGSKDEFYALNGPSLKEIVVILKQKYSLALEKEVLMDAYLEQINASYKKSNPFDDAQPFLENLAAKNIQAGLVTSGGKDTCTPILTRLNWNNFFDFCIFGDEVKKSKPDPEIYIRAWQKSECMKEEILVIEDSVQGIDSARAAGLNVAEVCRGQGPSNIENSNANIKISSLLEVLTFLE